MNIERIELDLEITSKATTDLLEPREYVALLQYSSTIAAQVASGEILRCVDWMGNYFLLRQKNEADTSRSTWLDGKNPI